MENFFVDTGRNSDKVSQRLVAFGKFGNLTFEQLATTQPGYVKWLFSQDWFENKYTALFEYLVGLGLQPKSTLSSSGEISTHNEYQARFIPSREELSELVQRILGEHQIIGVTFEHLCNADIVVEALVPKNTKWFTSSKKVVLLIELKPSVSNDYPEILRQIRSQHRAYTVLCGESVKIKQALVTQRYTGVTNIDVVNEMFGEVEFVIWG